MTTCSHAIPIPRRSRLLKQWSWQVHTYDLLLVIFILRRNDLRCLFMSPLLSSAMQVLIEKLGLILAYGLIILILNIVRGQNVNDLWGLIPVEVYLIMVVFVRS